MKNNHEPVFKNIDCIQFYVPDLQEGIKYYCDNLGLKVIWKTDTSIGLGMADGITEIVLQNERVCQEVDIKVNSVVESIEVIKKAGGQIIYGPFDIKIGKCAVVKDLWENEYVILDSTKGTFITDSDGNIIGQNSITNKT